MKLTERIEVFNQDCMEYMATLPDNAFELAIVDVPFGICVNHNMGRRKGDKPSPYAPAVWDAAPPEPEYFTELMRVSVNQIIWGANHFISRIPFDSPCWIVWDKGFSEDVSFASVELAWTSFTSTAKKFEKHPSQDNRIHPTQKPVALYRWLLTHYAKEGDKILDTHFGSLSSGIACHIEGFEYVGTELDPDYFQAACKRFREVTAQKRLFA